MSSRGLYLERVDRRRFAFKGNTFPIKGLLGSIMGAEWSSSRKQWEAPLTSLPDVKRYFPYILMDSDLEKSYYQLQARYQQCKAIKESKDFPRTIPGLKGELMPFQAAGVAFLDTLEEGEGGILAYDLGCGKTVTSIATFLKWKHEGIVDRLLVVCKAGLKDSVWRAELEKFTDLKCLVVDGKKPMRVEYPDGTIKKLKGKALREVMYQQWKLDDVDVLIMNYELFQKNHDYDLIKKYLPLDSRWCVILDEAHKIKNAGTPQSKNVRKLLKNTGRKILCSGTIMELKLSELWTAVDFCRPGLLGKRQQFQEQFTIQNYFGEEISPNYARLGELHDKLETVLFRVLKTDVLHELPPLTVTNYMVEMTKEQKKLYDQVREGILEKWTEDGEKEYKYLDILSQITRLQQVCDSPYLLREFLERDDLPIESGKLNALQGIIEDINPEKNKFILFSRFKEMAKILVQWMIDKEILEPEQIGCIYGGMTSEAVQKVVNGFQNGDIRCIVMTESGTDGLNLQAGTYVIAYDQLFNPQKMNQLYARCHRNGQTHAVTVINMITQDSYEEKRLEKLEERSDMFKAVIDRDEDVLQRLIGSHVDPLEALKELIA